jgi:hypothetical protein
MLPRDHFVSRILIQDNVGNTGKTFLAKYLGTFHNAVVFTNTTERDITCAYNKEPYVISDLARQWQDRSISYACMENLKNGIVFQNKYESCVKKFTPPSVIVFSNSLPTKHMLSLDRWKVVSLTRKDNEIHIQRLNCFNEDTFCNNNEHICNNKNIASSQSNNRFDK